VQRANLGHVPTFAVIVPAYRAERTLPATLASLDAQTRTPDEVIVVDDHAGRGPGWARNEGARRARSDWLVLLDADDVAHTDRIAALDHAALGDAEMLHHGVEYFDDTTGQPVRTANTRHDALLDALLVANPICASAVAVRRDVWQAVGGMREDLAGVEDWWMWLTLARRGRVTWVDGALSRYRVGVASLLRGRPMTAYAWRYRRLYRVARASGWFTRRELATFRRTLRGSMCWEGRRSPWPVRWAARAWFAH